MINKGRLRGHSGQSARIRVRHHTAPADKLILIPVDVATCIDLSALEVLAGVVDEVKIKPGDAPKTITEKFGPRIVFLAEDKGKIALRAGQYLFMGHPEHFVYARARYGLMSD